MRGKWSRIAPLVGLILVLAGVAIGMTSARGQAEGTPVPATPGAVVREVLGGGEPVAAPGQVLQLVRYTIPPNITLPVHTHPGMQVAWLESGTLQYTVVEGGEATITRAGSGPGLPPDLPPPEGGASRPDLPPPEGGASPGAIESLTAGQTTTLHPGDSWVESEGVVHFAQNATPEPVVILVASLLATGQPSAQIVTIGTPSP